GARRAGVRGRVPKARTARLRGAERGGARAPASAEPGFGAEPRLYKRCGMSEGLRRPFVSVKFSPAGRTYSFLLPDFAFDADDPDTGTDAAPPAPGDALVVDTPDGRAVATMTRMPTALSERRQPTDNSPNVVVRRATRD